MFLEVKGWALILSCYVEESNSSVINELQSCSVSLTRMSCNKILSSWARLIVELIFDKWTVNASELCSIDVFHNCCCPIRQPANPRARQHPQAEASPQEPEEPEEILGSDDEEQEDPNDYCKGGFLFTFCIQRHTILHCIWLTTLSSFFCLFVFFPSRKMITEY